MTDPVELSTDTDGHADAIRFFDALDEARHRAGMFVFSDFGTHPDAERLLDAVLTVSTYLDKLAPSLREATAALAAGRSVDRQLLNPAEAKDVLVPRESVDAMVSLSADARRLVDGVADLVHDPAPDA